MGYVKALEEAGAIVHDFKNFGSWQGDWWAKVTYGNMEGFVHGAFGSCTVCDAFQAEFHSVMHTHPDGTMVFGGYDVDEVFLDDCEECANTQKRLREFGLRYLDNSFFTKEEALEKAKKDMSWDVEADEMVKWIEER